MQDEISSRIRFGIVGLGAHATENLLPALQNLEQAEIRAISSRQKERATTLAARYQSNWSTAHWRDLLEAEDIDAILVAAPPQVHEEVATACLESGMPIFLEKPPAPDLPTLRKLAALAATCRHTTTFVDYNFRFGASYQQLRDALAEAGEISAAKIRFISSKPNCALWGQDSVEASFLYAVGIHAIEMAVDLFGNSKTVQVQHRQLEHQRFSLEVLIQFESAATVCLEFGNYSTQFEYRVELLTSRGAIGVLEQHRTLRLSRLPGLQTFDARFNHKQTLVYEWPSLHGGYDMTGYTGALQAFIDAVQHQSPSSSPITNSVEVYRITEEVLALLCNKENPV